MIDFGSMSYKGSKKKKKENWARERDREENVEDASNGTKESFNHKSFGFYLKKQENKCYWNYFRQNICNK